MTPLNHFTPYSFSFSQSVNTQKEGSEGKGYNLPFTSGDDANSYWESHDKTGIFFLVKDNPGVLNRVLQVFTNNGVNLTRIQSKPVKILTSDNSAVSFYLDFHGSLEESHIKKSIKEIEDICGSPVTIMGTPEVPWFPTQIEDFDRIGKDILGPGTGIQDTDHPGFKDELYKVRRQEIAAISASAQISNPNLPRVEYNAQETATWRYCYNKLMPLFKTNACKEFNETIRDFQKNIGFCAEVVPQLDDISKFLQSCTGWRLRPVGGLLTQREFLNGLAFRVFHSTQYIRHHTKPMYTPEPDIIHELLGHAPMFAHPDFAQFSQEIGLASLGADEYEIEKLAAIYWFTLEFGVCLEDGKRKAYGAGILSSYGELEYCVTDEPKILDLDPYLIGQQHLNYPISSMQPLYFQAKSFKSAKELISNYCENISRPFNVSFDTKTNSILVDRKIKTRKETKKGLTF